MQKDYYDALQLPPHATLAEIKQAYRRLAMMYHPDKHPQDPYASAQFADIKEAYEVLTDPARKEIYLQQRWYDQSMGRKKSSQTVTPVSILKLSLELEKYVSTLDVHRMNKEGLYSYVDELISGSTIEKLRAFNENAVNRQIITTLLMCTRPLPLQLSKALFGKFRTLAGDDGQALSAIAASWNTHRKSFLWNRYKIALMLVFTLLVCLLIYFTSK